MSRGVGRLGRMGSGLRRSRVGEGGGREGGRRVRLDGGGD